MRLAADTVLGQLPAASRYWVAYSGGVDSHVLLHLLAGARERLPGLLGAVHVDHQIQPQSGDWQLHCRAVCEELGLPFHFLRVDGRARPGESPEAAARAARYRALADWLPEEELLLTAQHLDDQAETLLLQLFRGAGPRGLAAMPAQAPLGRGRLLRPLLGVRRKTILDYARDHGLHWVEDPSNTDLRYHRNLLRRNILPQLRQHWPGLARVLARAAAHQADQLELADALGEEDLRRCRSERPDCLSLSALAGLSPARQRNLVRYWIQQQGLPLPPQVVLQRVAGELLDSRVDARPLVHWPGAELRRHDDRLYLMPPLPAHDSSLRLDWNLDEPLVLESAGGVLSPRRSRGQGLRRPPAGTTIEIRFRRGGEIVQPAGDRHHRPLKKLLQARRIPWWERERLPLLYLDGQLAAVAGLFVCEGFQARADEEGALLHWSRLEEHTTGDEQS